MSAMEHSDRERRIDQIIAQYYQDVELGRSPDTEQLIASHPDLEEELREFFADHDRFNAVHQEPDDSDSDIDSDSPVETNSHQTRRLEGQSFGEYQILEELGAGGMGVVYKARHRGVGRIVALKMIRAGNLASPQDIQRFQDEARAQARLCHQGIVAVHDVGSVDGQHYFTMDFVPGGSLSRLHRDEPVSSRRAAKLVRRLAESMDYAHQQGVIHRDLKPANILISANGAPRITDFGLAKLKRSDGETQAITMTETGQILGTAGYMSPEQAAGKKSGDINAKSDVYSLGAVLYALLTGRAPFVGESIPDTILQVIYVEPVSPRELNPSVPADLETICLKCLEKDQFRRYQTAQELADDLKRFLTNEPIVARPFSVTEKAWRWRKRNRAVFTLILSIAGTLLIGATISGLLSWRLLQLSTEAAQLNEANRELNQKLETTAQDTQKLKGELERQLIELKASQAAAEHQQIASKIERAVTIVGSRRPGQSLEAWSTVEDYSNGLPLSQFSDQDRQSLRNLAVSALLIPDLKLESTWKGELTASTDVAISPDLDWLAIGLPTEGRILVRRRSSEIADRMEIETPVSLNKSYFSFSGDAKWLSSFDYSTKTVRFLSLKDGEAKHQVEGVHNWRAVSFHPSQNLAAIGQNAGIVTLLDLSTGNQTVLEPEGSPVLCTRFSPDGKLIAVCRADGVLDVRRVVLPDAMMENELAAGQTTETLDHIQLKVPPGTKTIAWRPDGRMLAVGIKNHVELFELSNQQEPVNSVFLIGHEQPVIEIFWNSELPILATSSHDGTSRIWDAGSGRLLLMVSGSMRGFNRSGTLLAVRQAGNVGFYKVVPGTMLDRVSDHQYQMLAVHPALQLLGVGHAGGVSILRQDNHKVLCELPAGETRGLCFHPKDGSLIISSEAGLWRWPVLRTSVPAGVVFRVGPPDQIRSGQVTSGQKMFGLVRINGEGNRLLFRNDSSHSAVVFDLNEERSPINLNGDALSVMDISPDGRLVAGGDLSSREIQIWDTDTGAVIRKLPFADGFPYLRFSGNGQWLAANGLTSAAVWNVADWTQVHSIHLDCHGPAAIAFSPDHQTLAVGRWGRSTQLFDVQTAKPLATLDSPVLPVTFRDLSFSVDGHHLYGASDLGGAYSWKLGQLRNRLATVNLDWATTPLPPAVDSQPQAVNVTVELNLGNFNQELTTLNK